MHTTAALLVASTLGLAAAAAGSLRSTADQHIESLARGGCTGNTFEYLMLVQVCPLLAARTPWNLAWPLAWQARPDAARRGRGSFLWPGMLHLDARRMLTFAQQWAPAVCKHDFKCDSVQDKHFTLHGE